jgi:hypothetical protein
MGNQFFKKAKRCCSQEHNRLMENLSTCDSQSENPSERHRCYRVAARKSGRRSKKCIIAE